MKQQIIDYISNYKRLTKKEGYSDDLDLTQELGYSHIYQRLSELENIVNFIQRGTIQVQFIGRM